MTSTVPPSVFETNLQNARQYNVIFAGLTKQSACANEQVACVDGGIGRCSANGVFEITPCAAGTSCFALPMKTVDGVEVTCETVEKAREVLGEIPEGLLPDPTSTVTQEPSSAVEETTSTKIPDPSETDTQMITEVPGETPVTTTQAEEPTGPSFVTIIFPGETGSEVLTMTEDPAPEVPTPIPEAPTLTAIPEETTNSPEVTQVPSPSDATPTSATSEPEPTEDFEVILTTTITSTTTVQPEPITKTVIIDVSTGVETITLTIEPDPVETGIPEDDTPEDVTSATPTTTPYTEPITKTIVIDVSTGVETVTLTIEPDPVETGAPDDGSLEEVISETPTPTPAEPTPVPENPTPVIGSPEQSTSQDMPTLSTTDLPFFIPFPTPTTFITSIIITTTSSSSVSPPPAEDNTSVDVPTSIEDTPLTTTTTTTDGPSLPSISIPDWMSSLFSDLIPPITSSSSSEDTLSKTADPTLVPPQPTATGDTTLPTSTETPKNEVTVRPSPTSLVVLPLPDTVTDTVTVTQTVKETETVTSVVTETVTIQARRR